MSPKWRVELLGGLRVSNGDVVIRRFPSQKAAALFAHLAVNPRRSHAREEMAEALWPGDDIVLSRQRLNRLLNDLRNLFDTVLPKGTSIILTFGHRTIQLNEDAVETDLATFERLASVPQTGPARDQLDALRKAYDLYAGDLLPGFYEDRFESERLRLADLYGSVLTRLARMAEEENRLDEAAAACIKLVDLDPLQEEHHLSLIRIYGLRGQTSHALGQYKKLEMILRDELSEEPSFATKNLIESIKKREYSRPGQFSALSGLATMSRVALQPSPFITRELSSFFGRQREIEEAIELILTNGGRLLTLVGLSGSGKTRLAIEVSKRIAARSYQVGHVSLAEILSVDQVPIAIMRGLGITAPADVPPADAIVAILRTQPNTLLVLDNFEHFIDQGANLLSELIHKVPSLQLLITSLRKIDLPEERVLRVLPLETPRGSATPESLLKYAAVELFVDRAKDSNASFELTEENATPILAICEKLEGLPLAIELAAACAATMSPQELLEGINKRFQLLVSKNDTTPLRHRSLQSAIEHGYDLLPTEMQKTFGRLAVFEGGFDDEAAATICQEDAMAPHLEAFVERSLLRVSDHRYDMLETIREFAAGLLDQPNPVRSRHANHYRDLCLEAARHAGGANHAKWISRLSDEHRNWTAALKFYSGNHGFGDGLSMAISLVWYWDSVGPLAEGRQWLEDFLGNSAGILDLTAYASGLGALGYVAWRQGDFPFARDTHAKCLALRRDLNDQPGVCRSLYDLGISVFRMSDIDRTQSLMEESLALAEELDDQAAVARAVLNLGNIAMERGDFVGAKSYYEQAVRLERSVGNKVRELGAINNLGNLAYHQKRYVLAIHYFEECVKIAESQGNKAQLCTALMNLGIVLGRNGQSEKAIKLIGESMSTGELVGGAHHLHNALNALARLAAATGEPRAAALFLGGAQDLTQWNLAPVSHSDAEDREETEQAILNAISGPEFEAVLRDAQELGWQSVVSRALEWAASRE